MPPPAAKLVELHPPVPGLTLGSPNLGPSPWQKMIFLAEVQVSEKNKWKKMTMEFLQAQIILYEGEKKNEKGTF